MNWNYKRHIFTYSCFVIYFAICVSDFLVTGAISWTGGRWRVPEESLFPFRVCLSGADHREILGRLVRRRITILPPFLLSTVLYSCNIFRWAPPPEVTLTGCTSNFILDHNLFSNNRGHQMQICFVYLIRQIFCSTTKLTKSRIIKKTLTIICCTFILTINVLVCF